MQLLTSVAAGSWALLHFLAAAGMCLDKELSSFLEAPESKAAPRLFSFLSSKEWHLELIPWPLQPSSE